MAGPNSLLCEAFMLQAIRELGEFQAMPGKWGRQSGVAVGLSPGSTLTGGESGSKSPHLSMPPQHVPRRVTESVLITCLAQRQALASLSHGAPFHTVLSGRTAVIAFGFLHLTRL